MVHIFIYIYKYNCYNGSAGLISGFLAKIWNFHNIIGRNCKLLPCLNKKFTIFGVTEPFFLFVLQYINTSILIHAYNVNADKFLFIFYHELDMQSGVAIFLWINF